MNRILTLVPARPGRPGVGEVFQKPARIETRDRWLAVFYDGERIAKIKSGNMDEAHNIIAVKRAQEAAAIEAHNAKVRAEMEATAKAEAEAAERAAAALAAEIAAKASEGEGADTVASASEGEGADTLSTTQTESDAPKPVSHVMRRAPRKRKAKPAE